MKYREAVDILRNTNDIKSIQFTLSELIKDSIHDYAKDKHTSEKDFLYDYTVFLKERGTLDEGRNEMNLVNKFIKKRKQ